MNPFSRNRRMLGISKIGIDPDPECEYDTFQKWDDVKVVIPKVADKFWDLREYDGEEFCIDAVRFNGSLNAYEYSDGISMPFIPAFFLEKYDG